LKIDGTEAKNMTGAEKRNIVLCGFMATGKSSVGRQLAERLHWQFLDLDSMVEDETGMTVPQIFASQGESAFRALESRMVERIAEWTECVVATGGGAIVNPRNLEILKRYGVVISLTADIDTILQRVGTGDSRPMLQCEDRFERIRQLMEQREPFYARADIVLDTSNQTIEEIVGCLIERLQGFGLPL
jgi:shikimate kinase